MSEVDRAVLVPFVQSIKMTNFFAHFNISSLHVKRFQKWSMSSNIVLAKKIADVIRSKASARSKRLNLTIFSSSPDPDLHYIRTKQVLKVLQTSLAAAMYTEKNPHVQKFFHILFRFGQTFLSLIIGSQSRRRFSSL